MDTTVNAIENGSVVENGQMGATPAPAANPAQSDDDLFVDAADSDSADSADSDDTPADAVVVIDEAMVQTVTIIDAFFKDEKDEWKKSNKYRVSFVRPVEQTIHGKKRIVKKPLLFKGFVYNREIGESVEKDINYVDFWPTDLIEIFGEFVPGLVNLYTKRKQEYQRGLGSCLDAATISILLEGALVDMTREFYDAGQLYTDEFGNDKFTKNRNWRTTIDYVEITDDAQAALNAALAI